MTAAPRHSWIETCRVQFKTERTCQNPGCGLVKITDHSNPHGFPFIRFWHPELGDIAGTRTPQCPPGEVPL